MQTPETELDALKRELEQARAHGARLAAALSQFPFAFSLRDATGRVLTVNAGLCELIGLPAEQILGHRIDAVAPRFAALAQTSTLQTVLAERTAVTREVLLTEPDLANRQLYEVIDFPVFDSDGEVTTVGQTVKNLALQEPARWAGDRALLSVAAPHILANLGVWTRARHAGAEDWEEWSPQMYRLLGRDPKLGPLPLPAFLERVIPADRLLTEQAFQALHERDEPLHIELTITSDHGNARILRLIAIVEDGFERGLAQDVTVARDVAYTNERNIERYRHLFEDAPTGMLVNDLGYNLTDVNPALCRMLGYTREQMMKLDIEHLVHAGDMSEINAQRAALAAGQIESMRLEGPVMRADGRWLWTTRESALLRKASGEPFEIVTQVIDVSGARQQIQDLQRLADEDPLTGVMNRRSFAARLNYEIDAVRHGAPSGVVMMADVDKLKPVNDEFGHAAGDSLLIEFSHALRGHVRSTDFIGRLGGDEFAVLMPGCDRDQAERAAWAIVTNFRRERRFVADRELHSTISIGIARIGGDSPDGYEPLQVADAAMYRAKAAGGDRVECENAPSRGPN